MKDNLIQILRRAIEEGRGTVELEIERRKIRIPTEKLQVFEDYLRSLISEELSQIMDEIVLREEFNRNAYFLRRILEKRVDNRIRKKIPRVIAAIGVISVSTIVSIFALISGVESGFLPTTLAGLTLFAFTLSWIWKSSKRLI